MNLNNSVMCAGCGAVLEPWEEVFLWEAGRKTAYLCSDCFDAKISELSREEKALLMGSRVCMAEELMYAN